MKHLIFKTVIAIAYLSSSLNTNATTMSDGDGIWYYDFSGGSPNNSGAYPVTLINYSGEETGLLYIPSILSPGRGSYYPKKIRGYVFDSLDKFTGIYIPKCVKTIEENAFNNCIKLTEVIFDAENCTYMGRIDSPAFIDCYKLKNVSFSYNVKHIPNYAFKNCESLTSIKIENNVTTIGDEAFFNCTKVTSITCNAIVPPTCGSGVFDGIDKSTCELIVPEKSLDAYRNADQWKEFFMDEIDDVCIDEVNIEEVARYDIHGRLLAVPTKGINIIKMSDGTIRKEYVK